MKKYDQIVMKVESLAFGGRGVCRIDSENGKKMVAFVDYAAPGDEILAVIKKKKSNRVEAGIKEILKPSSERIIPRCGHFGDCGGCALQHLNYATQLTSKQQQVEDIMCRIGGFSDSKIDTIIGMEDPWFYRNKMEYSFGEDKEGNLVLGLHVAHSPFKILPLDQCFLQSESSNLIRSEVFDFLKKKNARAFHFKKNEGLLRNLTIREGKRTKEIMLILSLSQEDFNFKKELQNLFAEINRNLPEAKITSAFIQHIHVQKGKPTTSNYEHIFGAEEIPERLIVGDDNLVFKIHPDSFFQPNTFQAEILYQKVLDFAALEGTENLWDLYCGSGSISLFLAKKCRNVKGIEINEHAISKAKENAGLNNISNVEFIANDVKKELSNRQESPEVIVLDPPRAGLVADVINQLENFKPKKIIYVSCNPATMARDLGLLCRCVYRLKRIQPVDMFPQTGHVECVGELNLI